MTNQRYKLLTRLIVSALHPNEPQAEGTKWEPSNTIDIKEADELCQLKYAKVHQPHPDDVLVPTWLQRQLAAASEELDDEDQDGDDEDQDGDDEDQDGDDEDQGDERTFDDDELALLLDGTVDSVVSELENMEYADLVRLAELELEREKPRKGVADAIAEAMEHFVVDGGDDTAEDVTTE